MRGDPELMLNKRSETMQRCRHKSEIMLNNFYSRKSERQREMKRARQRMIILPEEPEEEGGPEGEEEEGGPAGLGGPVEEGGQTGEGRQTLLNGGGPIQEGGLLDGGGPVEEGRLTAEEERTNQRWMRNSARINYKCFL